MSEYFRKYIKKDYFPLHPTYFTNCILSSFQARGFKQTESDDWNIYWCEKEFLNETLDKMRLFPHKRVNHFRNWYEICRKDLLAKNIKKYKKQLEKEGNQEEANHYDFSPLTYNLPAEYSIFVEEYKKTSKAVWIMKPIGKSQGKGIFLFNKISEIEEWSDSSSIPEPYIVQRYIHNPLLIGNKKFDMRLYTLVTSHYPLTVYIFRSGFARFTHSKYEIEDLNSLDAHLTNVAVQKNCENYDEERGGKYFIDKLRLYMNSKFGMEKVDKCFLSIQELIVRTLIATSKLMINDKKCFELYGYDVMIDSNLKPWLIEINGSPSMSANTHADAKLKKGLLDDVFTVLNLEKILTGDEEQVGGFDLVYKDNKWIKNNTSDLNNAVNGHMFPKKDYSMIGVFNNREQNLRRMAKLRALKLPEEQKAIQSTQNTTNSSNNRSIRNPSINRTVPSNPVTRGKSLLNNSTHNSANQNKTSFKPGNRLPGSSINGQLDEGLKLPKVVVSTNTNVGIIGSRASKNNNTPARGGSRQSKR